MPASADRLRSIKSFEELIVYLETELDWPLQRYGFDELTFQYEPADLGLKDEDAAKVKVIHQLRPLESGQPWGIFFVEFERKKLPVVVLRRILSHLVIKKRASANKSERPGWNTEDMLFISSFGEEDTAQRELAFAHFHQEAGDLPTLRVLGWDGDDTPLKLEHADHSLHAHLRWPQNPREHKAWRIQWSRAFRHRIGHVIRTADTLAEVLASLARGIRNRCQRMMRSESERGALTKLFTAFQASLIHDLTPETFADTYAQTITYGLLTAAISKTDMTGGTEATALVAENVTDMVPVTNPFLKEMLQTFLTVGGRKGGIDFDELGIQDVVELLRGNETDLPAILRDFGNKNPDEDPVIHFYEHFLAAYDKPQKKQRGVFYTPQPVVSYIVRSVHELLQTEFGLADGLADTATWGEMVAKQAGLKLPPLTDELGEKRTISADEPFVQILDPATGTATFLVEVIEVIHRTLEVKWKLQRLSEAGQRAAWNDYVPKHLLPRLHAFELMMAPYAIAHMKIGLKLAETGYRFGTEERARIYLTNALEPKFKQLPQIGFDALANEAAAVNEIKWYKRFTVVIGNPPYAGISSNMSEHAQRLVDAYKIVDGQALNERKLWLQDDYVKFFRLAQTTVENAAIGILGLITNHGYLDNPTFRGMRQSLLGTFQRLRVLDLHGNANKKEQSPDGSDDKNVFDIRQGVAIFMGTRNHVSAKVLHAELWGDRASKYVWLSANSITNDKGSTLNPEPSLYYFEPQNTALRSEYAGGWSTQEILPKNGVGIVTARDALTIDMDSDLLWKRVQRFATLPSEKARAEYNLGPDVQSWKVEWAQEDVQKSGPNPQLIRDILYRPFDIRSVYYTGISSGFVCRPVLDVMRHLMYGENLGLITTRQTKENWGALVTKSVCGHKSCAAYDVNSVFPLYFLEEGLNLDFGDSRKSMIEQGRQRRPNLAPAFLTALGSAVKIPTNGLDGLPSGLTPENIFHYLYAVLHSPTYRTRYTEFLKIDFPRVPLPGGIELFRMLARLGGELTALHLLESPDLEKPHTTFVGSPNQKVEKVTYKATTVFIDKAQTTGFKSVPESVWNFCVGGYQVCEKWLKDRKSRTLSNDDVAHYHKIVVSLAETIRLMGEIDDVIEKHGGWPGAFQLAQA